MKDYIVNITGKDNLSATLKGIKQELKNVAGSATAIDDIRRKFEQVTNSSKPLKTQLRQLKDLMGQMKSKGLDSTYAEDFKQIEVAAGRTRKQMNQVNKAIGRAASLTPVLDQMGVAFNGLGAAANIASGAMGLFGSENEDAQKAMLKVQSIVAAGMGFSQLIPALKAAKMAQLGFNRVLKNNPYIIAIAAAIALATAIYKVVSATNKAAAANDDYIIKAKATKQLNEDIAEAHSEVTGSVAKEKNQINALTSIIHSNTATLDQKKRAINELRSIIPSYNATIDAEGTVHDNATTSIEDHIRALDDLQRAMTAYKTGEKIQQALADASFKKYQADYKVRVKQGNVNLVKKVLGKNEKSTDDYDPIYGTPIYKKSSTVKKREELKIQQASLDNAKRERDVVNEIYETRKKEAEQYKSWAKSYSSPKAQSAVAESGGDFKGASDIIFNRNNPTTPKSTGGGGRTGGTNKTTPVNTVETPSKQLQAAINESNNKVKFLQLQLDHNIINQEQYNSEYIEVQKTLLSAYEQNAQATGKISEAYKKQLDTVNKLIQEEEKNKYTNLQENISAEYTKLAQDRNKGLISETEYQDKLLDLSETYASALKDYVDKFPEAKKALETIVKESNKIKVSDKINEITKPYTKSVSLADRYKTPTQKELRQNKIDTNVSRYDELSGQISQLKELQNQVGKNTEAWQQYAEAIKGIESEQSKIVNETDSLVNVSKYEDLIEQVKKYKKELISVSYSSLKSGLSDISNIYSSFTNLSDNLDRANNGFEKFMVIMNNAFTVIDSVVGIINGVSSVISIIQGIAGANNALSVSSAATAGALGAQTASIVAQEAAGATKMASDIAQIATTKALTAALLEQAAAGFFAAHAYIPFAGFGIGAGFASSAAALVKSLGAATLLADGGVVGGNGYHGDTIIAGLNAGEMVLNRKQQANLFRALDNGIATNVGGKVEFEIKGSTLKGVLKNYDNKMNKVR